MSERPRNKASGDTNAEGAGEKHATTHAAETSDLTNSLRPVKVEDGDIVFAQPVDDLRNIHLALAARRRRGRNFSNARHMWPHWLSEAQH